MPAEAQTVRTISVSGPATINETDAAADITYTVTITGTAFPSEHSIELRLVHAGNNPSGDSDAGLAQAADFGASRNSIQGFAGSDTTADTSKTYTIPIAGDDLNEGAETFTLQVALGGVPSQATIDATAFGPPLTVTIADDDAVTVEITRASGTGAVAESSGALSFTVTIDGGTRATGVSTVVPFTIGGAGITADDYAITAPAGLAASATGGSVTIAQSASTATITVTITDDSLNEAQEMLTVTGGSLRLTGAGAGAVQYTTSGDTVSVAVTDNDPITVTLARMSGESGGINEGQSARFTVTLTDGSGSARASAGPITVAYALSGVADATASPASPLTFAAGDTEDTIAVSVPFSTRLDSGTENMVVALGTITPDTANGAGMASGTGSVTVVVTHVDVARTLVLRRVDSTYATAQTGALAENAGQLYFAASLGAGSAAFTAATEVTWRVNHDATGGTSDADFSAVTGAFTWPANNAACSTNACRFSFNIVDDNLSEMTEGFSVTLSVMAPAADSGTGAGSGVTGLSITDNDAITAMSMRVTGPATVNEESSAVYTVDLGAEVVGTTPVTVTIMRGSDSTAMTPRDYSISPAAPIEIPDGQRTGTFTLTTTDGGGEGTDDRTLTLTLTAMGGANTASMARTTQTITITEDDPVARSARVEAPAAAVARGVGQLASQAIVGRLRAPAGNTLTVAGQNMAGADYESIAAQYLTGGYNNTSAAELLRHSSFSLAHAGGGINFWGGGDYVSAEGDNDGVTYDGDTTAFHLGIDTHWRDGLIGVAVSTSDGDFDFTVTADRMKSKLETDVVSVHPYLTRRLNNSQLWLTAGHGSGDAELKEPGTVIKTDITVTTAAIGVSHALGEQLAARASALYSRAKLDAAVGDGKSLPATDADSTRLTAGLEAAWLAGPWRLFLASDARHDSGDGDTGGALDLGGGVEWKSPTVFVRLEGGGHLLGQDAADESRVSFTARKSTGRVTLGLNLGADATGLDTARLLYGEWRF